MVQSEVEERLRISPPVDAVIRWSGSTLAWMPSRPLTYGETYTVTLAKGGQSLQGRRVVRDVAWTFRVGHPRILYLSPDEQERLQLFVLSPDGGAAMQLTHAPGDVWDYAVSPDGSTIAYSVMREDGAADLWQVERDGGDAELLLACPEASCT
jgi:Tol biopolymer transport system component